MDTLPKVILKHSRIEVNDYNPGDSSYLEFLFSTFDPIYHMRFPKGVEYNEKRKVLYLPRGMNIESIKRIFNCEPAIDRMADPYVLTDQLSIKYLAKDNRQLEILKFLIGADQYMYTQSKSQLAVNSTTGSGKTFVTVAAMCITGSRMILITSSINWLNQWKDRILEYTELNPEQIYMIAGSASINKILTRDPLEYQVFLVSHATIHSYAESHKEGWYAVDKLFKYLKCSVKVFDEAHLYFDNMARIDFHSNLKKTIYLTATPARSSKEEDIIYQEYFKNVPSISLFDENIDPHVNYVSVLFYSNPTIEEVRNYSQGQFNFDRNIYTKYLINKPNFLNLVIVIIDWCLRINGKILIYIGINECISHIRDYIVQNFPFLQNAIGIYNSEISDKDARKQMLMKKFILSTTKSCGAASDIPGLAATVVLAEPFKSKVIARQTLGRCRADNTLYIDCVDLSCYRTRQYYTIKRPIFNQYAKSCKEILMKDDELQNKASSIIEYNSKHRLITIPVFNK